MIIDVSTHNGEIIWDLLKNKIDGAIIRCGYGADLYGQDDRQYARNVKECERLGIPYGVYLYSYAKSTADTVKEISHVKRQLKKCGKGLQLGVWLDLEEKRGSKNYQSMADLFVRSLRADGYTAGIYASFSSFKNYMPNYTGLKWCARWGSIQPENCNIWQYTDAAILNGRNFDASVIINDWRVEKIPTVDDIVNDIIAGKFGNGDDRKENIYKYFQDRVNRRVK